MSELSLIGKRVPDLGLSDYDVTSVPSMPAQDESSLTDFGRSLFKVSPPSRIGAGAVEIGYNLLYDESKKIDPFQKWKESGMSDSYFDEAMNVSTENEWEQFVRNMKSEEEANNVIGEYGLTGTAAKFVSSVALDPSTYATFGLGGMLKAGVGTTSAFAMSSAAGAAMYTGQEKIANQYESLSTEAVLNPMAGAIIGGLLGKGVDTLTKLQTKGIVKKDFHQMSRDALSPTTISEPLNLSAAATKTQDYRIGGNVLARTLNKAISIASPRARGQSATSKTTAEIYGKMFGTSARTKSNIEDLKASGASFGEETEKIRQQSIGRMRDFSDRLGNLQKSGHAVDETKFDEAARIMWTGVDNVDLNKVDPVVREILDFHSEYKTLKEMMISEKVPNFTSREDYGIPVIVSPAKATQKIKEVTEKNFNTLKEKQSIASQRISQIENDMKDLLQKYSKENIAAPLSRMEDELESLRKLSRASDEEIMDDAILTANQMATGRGNELHLLPEDQAKKLKPKFFDSRYINPLDYIDVLETNPYLLLGKYMDEVSPHIAFNRVFPEQKITSLLDEYKTKMDNEIKDALTSGDKKLADKLTKESNKALADIANGFDTETGMYSAKAVAQVGELAPYLNGMSNVTNMTMLGGQVMGSVSELSAIALHHGLGSSGLALTKALKSFASDPSLASVARKEAGYAGVGLELAKNKILSDMIGHELSAAEIGGNVGKFIHKGNVLFQRANLSVYYDSVNRAFGFIVQQGILKERLLKFNKLSKQELGDLAYLGIDKSNYKKINDQLKKFGEDRDGIFFSNADKWDDVTARETWLNVIRKDNRRTSVQSDLGEVPFFFRTPIGKNMFKFKSWSIAATQKYLIQSSQKGAGALPAIGLMVGFAGAVDVLYNKSQGKEVSTDVDELLWAGVNRSGVLGVLPEAGGSALVNKLAGIKSGGARVYDYNSASSILAGPTGSMAEDVLGVLPIPKMGADGAYKSPYKDKEGKVKESSVNHLIDLLPLPLVKPYLKGYGTPALINETN